MTLILSVHVLEQLLLAQHGPLPANSWVTNIAVALVASTALALNLRKIRGQLRVHLEGWGLLLLIVFTFVSIAWSVDQDFAFEHFVQHVPHLFVYGFIGSFCVVSARQLFAGLQVHMLFGTLLLVALQFCEFGYRGIIATVDGEVVELNPLSSASVGAHVAIVGAFMLSRQRLDRMIPFALFALAAGIFTIARGGSRGQLIGVILSLFVWMPLSSGSFRGKKLTLFALLILVAVLSIGFIRSSTAMVLRTEGHVVSSAKDYRFEIVNETLERFFDGGPSVWLLGHGTTSCWSFVGQYPHFVAVELLVELGFFGAGIFAVVMLRSFRNCHKLVRETSASVDLRCAFGSVAAMFTFEFLMSCKQGSFYGTGTLFFFSLCLARIASHPRLMPSQSDEFSQSADDDRILNIARQ